MQSDLTKEQASAAMYQATGRAITAFATVELWLCNHFALVTQMQPPMAKAVFFSARSLRGRLDMLESALASAVSAIGFPSLVPFLKVAGNRTGQWSGSRNMLAHGNIGYVDWAQSKYHGQAILCDSSTSDWPDPKRALTLADLEHAATNFGRLSALLMVSYNRTNGPNETTLKECHALALQLPTKATDPERRPQFLKRMSRLVPDGEYQAPLP